jgi:hypothetical protein
MKSAFALQRFTESVFFKHAVDLYAVGVPFDFDYMHRAMDKVAKIKDPFRSAVLLVKNGILYRADTWYQDCLKGMAGHDLGICHSADVAEKRKV